LPTQQPAQFDASHRLVLHAPEATSHERPCAPQSVHACPLRPHAEASLPARHTDVPPCVLQQPLAHVAALQLVTLRPQTRRASQNWKPPATQSLQRAPARPQARRSEPVRQMLFASQHPVGHVEALHVPGVPPSLGVSSSRLERPQPEARRTKNSDAKSARLTKRASEGRRMAGAFRRPA